MSTTAASSATEPSAGPRYYNHPPRWLTRSLVACPRCHAWIDRPCFGGRKGSARRGYNHLERTLAAEAILARRNVRIEQKGEMGA